MSPVHLKTTRYGLSVKAGGWDGVGDSGTDAWMGCFGNKLTTSSCALTVSAEALIVAALPFSSPLRIGPNQDKLAPHALLRLTWDDVRFERYVTFDDRAPEDDPRCDVFMPWVQDYRQPDFGYVAVVDVTPAILAAHPDVPAVSIGTLSIGGLPLT